MHLLNLDDLASMEGIGIILDNMPEQGVMT